ncbi:hypothetical protein [Paraglaciecola sp.]|uniref:hypothetical protein n=1 Tax=Paraglaciecola sp. TaxID=1920173 RepID=UPI003EF3B8B2
MSLLFSLRAHISHANEWLFNQANCTIIYSLKSTENNYFNQEIDKLESTILTKKITFIDLNNWRSNKPHKEISGRQRNQIRQIFALPKNINQVLVFDNKGRLIRRHSGSVALVNTLFDCPF